MIKHSSFLFRSPSLKNKDIKTKSNKIQCKPYTLGQNLKNIGQSGDYFMSTKIYVLHVSILLHLILKQDILQQREKYSPMIKIDSHMSASLAGGILCID
jgi:hypothetical protein